MDFNNYKFVLFCTICLKLDVINLYCNFYSDIWSENDGRLSFTLCEEKNEEEDMNVVQVKLVSDFYFFFGIEILTTSINHQPNKYQ